MIRGMVSVAFTRDNVIVTLCPGMKNVAKNMKSIAVGPVKKPGKTWFPELSDKS